MTWQSHMAFCKSLKAQERGVLRVFEVLRSRNLSPRILRNRGSEVQVNETEKLRDDHSLGKCQLRKKKAAERRLLHSATKDKPSGRMPRLHKCTPVLFMEEIQ